MDKSANTAWAWWPVLLLWNACEVYDPSLHRGNEGLAARREATEDAATPNEHDATDATEAEVESSEELCGNGLIDPGERCDIAIARARPGACPEGCSGREACVERVLVGHACALRCADVTITSRVADDGCCPPDTSAAEDSDCAGECGNGIIERGERCDPPSSCARRDACVSMNVCESARYSGEPDRCTAVCELRAIEACVSEDGCCPPGCTHEADRDCEPPPVDPGSCRESCEPAREPDLEPDAGTPPVESDCQMRHDGAACEACDCEMCQAETLACLTAPGEGEATKCEAVIRCASEANCTNLECLCGNASTQQCRNWPVGRCVSEIRAAGGARDVYQLIQAATEEDTALGRAVAVMTCRREECRRACGL